MPGYEYDCRDCNICFTVYLSVAELESQSRIKCPHCGSDNVIRKISAFFTKTSKKS